MVSAIHEIPDRADVTSSRLQHGDGRLTILIEDAARRHLDTCVSLEDTIFLPDGSRTPETPRWSRPPPSLEPPVRLATRLPAPAPLVGRQPEQPHLYGSAMSEQPTPHHTKSAWVV
jgi:hypothetical protein